MVQSDLGGRSFDALRKIVPFVRCGNGVPDRLCFRNKNSLTQKNSMKQDSTRAIAFTSLAVYLAIGIGDLRAQTLHDSAWQKEAEPRLRAIYERGEFRPRSFRAEWLADSSAYTIRERDPKTKKSIVARYDVRTGKRTEEKSPEAKQADHGKRLSPDGERVLEFRDGNISVRDLESGRRTQLTKRSAERDISYRSPVWSPDGKRVAFVESDSTDVRLRPVLVPDDPSCPGVENRLQLCASVSWTQLATRFNGCPSTHLRKASIWGKSNGQGIRMKCSWKRLAASVTSVTFFWLPSMVRCSESFTNPTPHGPSEARERTPD